MDAYKSCPNDLPLLRLCRVDVKKSYPPPRFLRARDTLQHRQKDVEVVTTNLEMQRAKNHQLLTEVEHVKPMLSKEKKNMRLAAPVGTPFALLKVYVAYIHSLRERVRGTLSP